MQLQHGWCSMELGRESFFFPLTKGLLFLQENGRMIGLLAFLRCFGYQREPRIYGAAINCDIDTLRYLTLP